MYKFYYNSAYIILSEKEFTKLTGLSLTPGENLSIKNIRLEFTS